MFPAFERSLFSEPAIEAMFGDAAAIAAMVRVEAALARALGRAGVVGSELSIRLAEAILEAPVDPAQIGAAGAASGTPVIALVKALREHVGRVLPEASSAVHLGATSQDIIDTARVLQMRDGLDYIDAGLAGLSTVLAELAQTHRRSIMLGRTLLQPGPPITFGLKMAQALGAIERCRIRLNEAARLGLLLQFGGAVGTLSGLGVNGIKVADALAAELKLPRPATAWGGYQDGAADIGASLSVLLGILGKLGHDMALLAQFEVSEVQEGAAPGRGGSSTMPHKRNPVLAMTLIASAHRGAMLGGAALGSLMNEHERGLGGWQASVCDVPELFRTSAAAVRAAGELFAGLEVNVDRMRQNFDATGGVVMAEAVALALAPLLGQAQAQAVLEAAVKGSVESRVPLSAVLARIPQVTQHLSTAQIQAALDPAQYLGSLDAMIDAARLQFAGAKPRPG